MKVKLITIFILMITPVLCYAQRHDITDAATARGKTIVFRFVAESDIFFVPYQGNGDKLSELVATIDHYKNVITNGEVTINVAGYCSSYITAHENLKSAAIRANRVKSELIVRNGIKEENFLTTVHSNTLEGHKSVVVVTLRVPQVSEPATEAKPIAKEEPKKVVNEVKPEPAVEQSEQDSKPKPETKPESQPVVEQPNEELTPKSVKVADNYQFALRTNLLYDAMLVPNIGVEWKASESFGIKVDAGGSNWGKSDGNIQKTWYINPEVRYYMGKSRRFYVGLGGNYGRYNIYKGMFGNIISKDTGYQGSLWNAGAIAGYQLSLSTSFSLDFNLGLGYDNFSYDSFEMINDVRVYKEKDQSKGLFGITQAGVSLVWKLTK